ncbi:MAG: helix-turn-helix transcriptional regulator [Clostridia bacterium]|nr:helix-turn-helix transcriptional regulator [Clostridia bacterium]
MDFSTKDASVQEVIKHILTRRNMTISELATKLNTSKQNLSNKFRRGNLSEKDLVAISEAMGYKVVIQFEEMEVYDGKG